MFNGLKRLLSEWNLPGEPGDNSESEGWILPGRGVNRLPLVIHPQSKARLTPKDLLVGATPAIAEGDAGARDNQPQRGSAKTGEYDDGECHHRPAHRDECYAR